jgi:hypothetical protein
MEGKNEASESLSKLSMELGLSFPPSTRLIGVLRSNGMDDAVRVKLEIAATEFPSFLEQTGIDGAGLRPGTRGMLGPDRDFWDPHQSQVPAHWASVAPERALAEPRIRRRSWRRGGRVSDGTWYLSRAT